LQGQRCLREPHSAVHLYHVLRKQFAFDQLGQLQHQQPFYQYQPTAGGFSRDPVGNLLNDGRNLYFCDGAGRMCAVKI
jgi:hypothetical protein